jgi:23S rRNA (cytidine2498-2'-O)-methyltransferase
MKARAEAGLPGIVSALEPTTEVDPLLDPVFARQQLPDALPIEAPSVAALAEACYAAVQDTVDGNPGPFTIHVFAPTGAGEGLGSRATLIAAALLERLRDRRRRAARAYRPPEEAAARFGEIALLLQVLVVDRTRAWVSAAKPRALSGGGWTLAPWPAGAAPIADDKRPPSRAYRKLEEALLWMGEGPKPGQTCVDLGAAPGGWTYVALARGARVTAVDRAPVEPPVRGHRALTMVEGNAFTYEPPAARRPVDWLVCDVICEPARTIELLGRWLTDPWCRRLVVTVKFKGQSGYGAVLDELRATLLSAGCPRWRIKHLHHNKNEVTVLAAARRASSG